MKIQMPFTMEEYQSRVSKVRKAMNEKGIDVFVITTPSNINYLTAFRTTGFYIFHAFILPAKGDPVMVIRQFETANVTALTWITNYVPVFDTGDTVLKTAEVLAELGYSGKVIGYEEDCWYLTPKKLNAIRNALPGATFKPIDGIIESLRVIKSPQEIEYIRMGAQAASYAATLGLAAIRVGATENQVAAEVYRGLLEKGSTYPSGHPYVLAGARSSLPHATYENGVIQKGDVVFLEIGGCFHRYGGSIMRTGVAGKPKDIIKKMAEAAIAGLEAALKTIRPGLTSGDVDQSCRGAIQKLGMGERFLHRTGYSIGVAFPQGWGEGHIFDLKPDDPREVKENMTFHLVPLLFEPGVACVGFSETVRVTKDGIEKLSDCKRELYISDK